MQRDADAFVLDKGTLNPICGGFQRLNPTTN
jgi:hypothetical protein